MKDHFQSGDITIDEINVLDNVVADSGRDSVWVLKNKIMILGIIMKEHSQSEDIRYDEIDVLDNVLPLIV